MARLATAITTFKKNILEINYLAQAHAIVAGLLKICLMNK